MAKKDLLIPLDRLLKQLELNGHDVHAGERAQLIEDTIEQMYPGYHEECVAVPSRKLMKDAKEAFKLWDDFTVKFKEGHYEIGYHVSAGCNGDWHESETYSAFVFLHKVRGYKQLF